MTASPIATAADTPMLVDPALDAICQKGIDAALCYIRAGRPQRARFVLTRAEMQARRYELDQQTHDLERAVLL